MWNYQKGLKLAPSLIASTLLLANAANAEGDPNQMLKQLEEYNPISQSQGAESLETINSVSKLRDVRPTDWAYSALQSLAERYGCLLAYPDNTYRGNRALTRYEFAAGLDACLNVVQRLIQEGTSKIGDSDISSIKRLQEEFGAELATLRAQVDGLEVRTAEMEANQFSTTTKLEGEAIFALTGVATGDDAAGNPIDRVTAFGHRTRLNFETSFTGDDLLRTRLQVGNLPAFSETATLTPQGDQPFASDSGNAFEVDALLYSKPVSENLEVTFTANAGASDDFASTVNPFFDGDGASGSLSSFGMRHPIYYLIENAGMGLRYAFNEKVELGLGYMATDGPSPTRKNGLFNGAYGAMAQLLLKPSDRLQIALTYLNAYNNETGTGSNLSNFRTYSEGALGKAVPIISNAYGVEASWQLHDHFAVGGWVGYINAQPLSTLNGQIKRGSMDIWNWAVNLSFPDIGKPGSLAGILVGMEPRVTSSSVEVLGSKVEDPDTGLHLEAFYQYPMSDHIAITPGIIWLTAPDHNAKNDDVVIGTIRTTFNF
ncbi:MAG: iron uptake porin [Oscillatoriaceae cyanobacterium]